MPLTIAEGSAPDKVWAETPKEVQDVVLKQLETTGMVVRTKEQDTEYVKTLTQKEADKVYRTHQETTDAIVLEATGLKRLDNEKTSEFVKRAISEKLKGLNELETKIKDYEAKGADGNALAQEYKKRTEELQSLISKKDSDYNTQIQTLKGEVFGAKVSTNVQSAFADIKLRLKSDTDPKLMEDIIFARMTKFNNENKAKEIEGMIFWTDADGNTRSNRQDGKPLLTKEVLEPYFVDLMDEGKKAGGAGSGSGGSGGTDTKLPDDIKSKQELWKYLRDDKKLNPDSKEFNDQYQKLGKDLPLTRKK